MPAWWVSSRLDRGRQLATDAEKDGLALEGFDKEPEKGEG